MTHGALATKNLGLLLKDDDMVLIVDTMAKRYGLLPYDVLSGQTLYQFNFNVAIMINAIAVEARLKKEAQDGRQGKPVSEAQRPKTYRDFGIKRTVISK